MLNSIVVVFILNDIVILTNFEVIVSNCIWNVILLRPDFKANNQSPF